MAAASRGRSWLVVLSYLCIIMRSTDAQKSLYQVKGEDYMLGDAGPAGRQSTNDKLLNTVTSTISPEDCETKYDKMKTAFKVCPLPRLSRVPAQPCPRQLKPCTCKAACATSCLPQLQIWPRKSCTDLSVLATRMRGT